MLNSYYNENGNRVKPKHFVSYIVTAYPDYADEGEFVTQIDITDPNVSIYGLNTNSTFEEWDAVFRKMGYIISQRTYASGAKSFTAEKFGNVTFSLYDGGDDGVPMISVRVKVSNRDGIEF